MLQNYLMPKLQQDVTRGFILQQDGAPSHFHYSVTTYLSHLVPVWIGRREPITWTPRSPDLTLLDFCLWGYAKHCLRYPLQQAYISYVNGSKTELRMSVQICLGGHTMKYLTGGASAQRHEEATSSICCFALDLLKFLSE
jgi:hypothetical protein